MKKLSDITKDIDLVKEDIVNCHNLLKKKLINRNVNVLENDKLKALIDKLDNIPSIKNEEKTEYINKVFILEHSTKLHEIDLKNLRVLRTFILPSDSTRYYNPRGLFCYYDKNTKNFKLLIRYEDGNNKFYFVECVYNNENSFKLLNDKTFSNDRSLIFDGNKIRAFLSGEDGSLIERDFTNGREVAVYKTLINSLSCITCIFDYKLNKYRCFASIGNSYYGNAKLVEFDINNFSILNSKATNKSFWNLSSVHDNFGNINILARDYDSHYQVLRIDDNLNILEKIEFNNYVEEMTCCSFSKTIQFKTITENGKKYILNEVN